MIAPLVVVLRMLPEVIPVMAKVVEVAALRSEVPRRVVEAMTAERFALNAPPRLRVLVMVDEPTTLRALVVAEVVMRLVWTALVEKKLVDDALVVVPLTAKRFDMSAFVEKKLVEVALVEVLLMVRVLFPVWVRKETRPVFDTEKSVVDAPVFEVEPMEKRRLLAMLVVEAACMEKRADGEEEPTPTDELKSAVPPTLMSCKVEEPVTLRAVVVAPTAVSPPLKASCVVVALPMNG
jgi:hypothetical protein